MKLEEDRPRRVGCLCFITPILLLAYMAALISYRTAPYTEFYRSHSFRTAHDKYMRFDYVYRTKIPAHRLVDFDLTSIQANAQQVGIILPTEYSVGVCHHGILLISHSGRLATFECSSREYYTKVNKLIPKHVVLAYDVAFGGFQHDMMGGIPSIGMLLDWVLERPDERAYLCTPAVCNVLKHVVPSGCIVDLGHNEQKLYPIAALSLRFPFNQDIEERVTADAYPIGAYVATQGIIAEESGEVEVGHVLFLSRGGFGSARYIDNEAEVVARIGEWCQERGKALHVMAHGGTSAVWNTSRVVAEFSGASHVIGLHGGSFANLVYCRRNTTVIEMNVEEAPRRDCFGAMALSVGLRYKRFPAPPYFTYGDLYNVRNHFPFTEEMMSRLLAMMEL